MVVITSDKLQEIINNRPAGSSADDVIKALQKRGHTIEGQKEQEIPFNVQQNISGITPQEEKGGGINFFRRLALSFGGPKAKQEIVDIEKKAGTRGSFDVGDIADVAGSLLPLAGGILGATGGTIAGTPVGGAVGAGIGTTAGEATKRAIGRLFDVREDVPTHKEITGPLIEGATTAIAGKAIKGVSAFVSNRYPKLLGIFTGESDDVIRSALNNPKAADQAIIQGDMALRKAVQKGAETSLKLKNDFIKGHSLAFEKIAGRSSRNLLSRKEVIKDFSNLMESNGVRIGKGGILDFGTSKIIANPGEVSKIQLAYNAMRGWKDFSLKGTNELKQLTQALTRFADEAGVPAKSPTLAKFQNLLNKRIVSRLSPKSSKQYLTINKKFAENIELFDDMADAFNKGDTFARLAGLFGKNKDTLRQVIEFYEKKTGQPISAIVAGRELGMEKTAAFGFLNPRSWIDFFISPQTQTRVVTRTGKVTQSVPITKLAGFLRGL